MTDALHARCAICNDYLFDPTETPGLSTTRGTIMRREDGTEVHARCVGEGEHILYLEHGQHELVVPTDPPSSSDSEGKDS